MRILLGALLVTGLGMAIAAEPAPDAGAPAAKKKKPVSKTVKLGVTTGGVTARVYYGRKLLGTTPLKFSWKRDSGPLDLVLRAGGYLPVNTRLYTFKDETISVRMTRFGNEKSLYGYKEKLPPDGGVDEDDPNAPDAGVAAPTPALPVTPVPTPAAP